MSSFSNFLDQNVLEIIEFLHGELIKKSFNISIAESCTGGFLSSCFTSYSGASSYFKGSIVAYNNELKVKFLNINQKDISQYGVASQAIVELMARNIQKKFNTNFGLATTGYVDGFSNLPLDDKNDIENYAWIAIATEKAVCSKRLVLNGDRVNNISVVSLAMLEMLRKEII